MTNSYPGCGFAAGSCQFWLDSLRQSDILGYIFEETAKEVISRAALSVNNFCIEFILLRCTSFSSRAVVTSFPAYNY